MDKHSFCLQFLRRPLLWRDLLVVSLCSITWMMPCYAGVPGWWTSGTYPVIATGSTVVQDDYAAVNVGQMKHMVSKAVLEMGNLSGGAGLELNTMVSDWSLNQISASNSDMVNVGQLKAVMKKVYDRLNEAHGTTGYPWPTDNQDSFWQAVNVGQLKNLLYIDVSLPPDRNLTQGLGTEAQPTLTPPTGAFANRNTVLSAADHYSRNPQLSLLARGSATGLPPNAANIDNAPVATTPGEFKVGQDGSASYSIHLQGPKGVGNVEPGISLEYSSNGGDGVAGLGWSLGGISAINRGPATKEVDGFNDPVDFDGNDRFYLDGDRLICVSAGKPYGTDGSEYRTLREQFSRITYHKTGTQDSFTVETKAGLKMTFGQTALSSVRPWQNGDPTDQGRLSWALDRVEDNLGNYWEVVYGDLGLGASVAGGKPYFPDYQPLAVRYTGRGSRAPMHEIRFVYETRPDQTHGYSWGALVRKEKRLQGVEISTSGSVIRSYKLRYNLAVLFEAKHGERSRLEGIQEFAGPWSGGSTPRLPETNFEWTEGENTWTQEPTVPQTLVWKNASGATISAPAGETNFLRTEYRLFPYPLGNPAVTTFPTLFWQSLQPAYVDLNGDGLNEIFINHRGAFYQQHNSSLPDFSVINDHRRILSRTEVPNEWSVTVPTGAESGVPMYFQTLLPVDQYRGNSTFPYLTTASAVPTGAYLMDINGDGLPDIVSSGSFDEAYYVSNSNGSSYSLGTPRKIDNAQGVWINTGGNFSEAAAGTWDFPLVPTEYVATPGGAITARPTTTATELCSGTNEILKLPEFAQFKEDDLGWRVVDLDGDGYTDIIRAGQGLTQSGWETATTPSAIGTGALSTAGRELCFGLRNK
ncbi:MAG: SpvB/TcaC N-terminal domain-containing protein, partial [Prosthecobacter sp.]